MGVILGNVWLCRKKKHHPLYNPSNVTIAAHDPSNKSINNRPQNVKKWANAKKKAKKELSRSRRRPGVWSVADKREPCYGYRNLTKLNVKPSPSW